MANEKVLIVDDDPDVLNTLYKVIKSNGFDVTLCENGSDALKSIAENNFDCMLCDINMQGINGFEVIKEIRKQGHTLPIIIVSGRKEDYDTLYGLDIGADDYITKPFNPVVLGAKVKATIRRNKQTSEDSNPNLTAGPFSYNTSTLKLYKNGTEIPLTSKENAMMKLFMDNINHIFSKDMLYEMVWNENIIDENAIMVYINRLRQKIEEDPSHPKYLQNVRGLGYRFIVNKE